MAAKKSDLRIKFRQVRAALPTEDLNQEVCQHLLAFPPLQAAKTVLTYIAVREEVSLELLRRHWPEKTWGIPRCGPERAMTWHDCALGDPLPANRWGIPEPLESAPIVDPSRAEVVLVPALACDRWGIRLGYGGGFYDRFLSQELGVSVGIVPQACFSRDPLPRDDWDVTLAWVATETGVWPCQGT